jgi:hypothetical protein
MIEGKERYIMKTTRTFKQNAIRSLKITGIIVGVLTLLFIALIVIVSIADPVPATSTTQPTQSSTHAPTVATTTRPTSIPTHVVPTMIAPTATVKPVVPTVVPTVLPTKAPVAVASGPAVLGASIASFEHTYGAYNDHTSLVDGSYHWLRYADTQVVTDALIVWADNSNSEATKYDANSIDYAPEQGVTKCEQFFPRDAQYMKQVAVASGTDVYIDRIYVSASLATVFPASAFTDAQQNPVKAGTFDVLNLGNNECTIQIGDQQTQ